MNEILVGRTTSAVYRGFVSFDIGEIPANATIVKATLRLYQYSLLNDPYQALGALKIDHLDYGTTLENDDFNGGNVYSASFATFGTSYFPEWKNLDVTEQVKKDHATHTSSQFRLHFTTEERGGPNLATFSNPSATGTSDIPQLVIEYTQ
jgi:hypothetical protein